MKIGIVGAGPAGLLLAQHLLKESNYDVHIFEKESDPLLANPPARSFPITLQGRGMTAIRAIDPSLERALVNSGNGKWMDSVSFHFGNKQTTMKRPTPSFMIEQGDLKREMQLHLLETDKLSSTSSLSMHFDCDVQDLFLHNQTILARTTGMEDIHEELVFDRLVVADGSKSRTRELLAKQDPDFSYEMKNVPGGYKIMTLDRWNQEEHKSLDSNSIHGWMAGNQNFLSVPLHEDHSSGIYAFTEDTDPMATLGTPSDLQDYIRQKLPSMASFLSKDEAALLFGRKAATLCTVRCGRLTAGSHYQALLLGDAAHTFSSSLNQGCNAALQDVQVFQRCLRDCGDDWTRAMIAYNAERTVDIDAAHELSDYSLPRTNWQRAQFFGRMLVQKLGSSLGMPSSLLPPPLPMELIHNATLSYSDILTQCQGWIQQVKESSLATEEEERKKGDPNAGNVQNAGKLKQLLIR